MVLTSVRTRLSFKKRKRFTPLYTSTCSFVRSFSPFIYSEHSKQKLPSPTPLCDDRGLWKMCSMHWDGGSLLVTGTEFTLPSTRDCDGRAKGILCPHADEGYRKTRKRRPAEGRKGDPLGGLCRLCFLALSAGARHLSEPWSGTQGCSRHQSPKNRHRPEEVL